MPQKIIVNSTAAPTAIGPYSQAVRVGDLVYTSGQVGFDPATGNLVEGGIAEQTERVCENLRAVLNAVDLTLTDVIKTTVFLQDMNDFAAMNEVYARHFAPENYVPPARSTVQVAKLPRGGLVEIECIAMVGLDH
jgi:2-iminobutanoate/2-iminopropanoate deaminase